VKESEYTYNCDIERLSDFLLPSKTHYSVKSSECCMRLKDVNGTSVRIHLSRASGRLLVRMPSLAVPWKSELSDLCRKRRRALIARSECLRDILNGSSASQKIRDAIHAPMLPCTTGECGLVRESGHARMEWLNVALRPSAPHAVRCLRPSSPTLGQRHDEVE
jgi:hypothetical protein